MKKTRIPKKAKSKTSHYRILYDRQNGICGICKKPILFGKGNVDHIIPKSKGGSNELYNKQLTHYSCNILKADKILDINLTAIK